MNIKNKIKESTIERIAELLLALLALLIAPMWLALKSAIAQRILPALSKETLAGLLVVAIALLLAASAYIFHLRRKLHPKLLYRFGVLWDKALSPLCPKDKMPLQVKKAANTMERFPDNLVCVGCDRRFELTDENGFAIFTVKDAKQKMTALTL